MDTFVTTHATLQPTHIDSISEERRAEEVNEKSDKILLNQ